MQSLKDLIREKEGIHGKSLLSRRSFNFLVGGDADNNTSSWRDKLKQEACSICTEAISNKPFILLPCTHVFHAKCIINYISDATNTGHRNVRTAEKIYGKNSHSQRKLRWATQKWGTRWFWKRNII